MNDDNDRSVRSAFDDLQRSVDSAVDVNAAHARFEQLRAQPLRGRRSRRGWAIGAAAAAATVLIVIGLATMWPYNNKTTQVITGGTVAPTTTEVSRPPCPTPGQLFIYMNPDVAPPEVYDVSTYLGNLDGVDSLNYMDEEDTYEEFTQLFADEPDLVDSVEPGDLPTSFRPVRDIPWDEATLNTLESLPGVRQVQSATEQFTPDCVEPSPEEGGSEDVTAGSTGPESHDAVPGKGIVDQPLGPDTGTDEAGVGNMPDGCRVISHTITADGPVEREIVLVRTGEVVARSVGSEPWDPPDWRSKCT
jgi:hypothetical protein